jgi:hypothetical protein
MDELREQYRSTTIRILGMFQLLEFCLKVYIGLAYKLISRCINGKIHFGYSASDVETFPLERLLTIFSKLNANTKLQKRLSKLRDSRNHIAHKSLLLAMRKNYNVEKLREADESFFYLEDEVMECLRLIIEETQMLKALQRHLS